VFALRSTAPQHFAARTHPFHGPNLPPSIFNTGDVERRADKA
jgi:hypothetical protein